jgi:hypothetical protein
VPAAVAFVLVLTLVCVAIVESKPVQERARRWAVALLCEATGLDIDIEALRWQLFFPTVALHGVSINGAGLAIQIESAEIELGGFVVIDRELRLDTVSVEGVRVEATGVPEAERPSPREGWMRVRVGHLDLRHIELIGRELPGGVEIQMSDVDATWSMADGPPRGYVRVDAAHLDVPGIEPIDLEVGTRFRFEDQLYLDRVQVRGAGVRLEGAGMVTRTGFPVVNAQGWIDLAELDRIVRARAELTGRISVDIGVDPAGPEQLRADIAADKVSAAGFPVKNLGGRLVADRDGLTGFLERASFHSGSVQGQYLLTRQGGRARHRVNVHGSSIVLASLLKNLGVPPGELAARSEIDVDLDWLGRSFPSGSGLGTAVFEPTAGGLPVDGQLQVRLDGTGVLLFSSDNLTIGSSTFFWQGPLTLKTWEPAWSVRAMPADLHEIIPLVNGWIGSTVLPEEVSGSGDLQISFAGPWSDLRVGLRLEAFPIAYPPLELDRLTADASISNGVFELESAFFRIGAGNGSASGRIAWDVADEDQLDLSFRAQKVPLETLAGWIGFEELISGDASFTGKLTGPVLLPRGSWAVGLANVRTGVARAGDGSASVALEKGRFDIRALQFSEGLSGLGWWHVSRGEVGGDLRWTGLPLDGFGEAPVALVGERADAQIEFRWPLDGEPVGRLELTGPRIRVVTEASDEAVDIGISLPEIGTADLNLKYGEGGSLVGGGKVEITAVERIVSRLLPDVKIPLSGAAEADLEIEASGFDTPTIRGQLQRINLVLDERPVILLEPARFDVDSRGVQLHGLLLKVLEDELFMRWKIAADGNLEGNFSGTFDALLARFVLPEWQPSGKITGIVELLGTLDEPRLEGITEFSQFSFRLPGSRQVVSGVTGTVLLSADEASLEGLDFRFMGGAGRLGGRLKPRGGTVELALAGTVERAEIPLYPGFSPRLQGEWRLLGVGEDLELSGDLVVQHGSLRRNEDLATILIDWFGQPEIPEVGKGLALDLRVQADRTLEARNAFLRLVGSAALNITGTTVRPGLVGRLDFQEGGEITFMGARYELDRGSITFSDPLVIDPFIDIQLRAWVESYQVMVGLTGTLDRLVPTFVSDPPLPEAEIFSLMTLGRRVESPAGEEIGIGLASAFLNRQLNAELERRARELLPVDQVRVDPFSEASSGNPTARVTMVKQVNPRWTVVVQGNLSANREEVVVSRWYLSRGLFLEATRDLDGRYAIDLKLRRRY